MSFWAIFWAALGDFLWAFFSVVFRAEMGNIS
jgi:hypothetical protein